MKEQDVCNMSKEEDADSCSMSEEQDMHDDFHLEEEQHVSIQNGGLIPLAKCVECCNKYHCPFCKPEVFKPTVKSKVRKHIRAHEKRAVRFKGFVIFKCGLDCRPVSHFHCPNCHRLSEKKNRFVHHLIKCVDNLTDNDEGQTLPVMQEADHQDSEEEEDERVPEEKDQGFHPKVVPRPALPADCEDVSLPQPNHKPASTNQHNSTSSRTVGNSKMKKKEGPQKIPFVKENTPTSPSACSKLEEKSWGEAVKSLQSSQETSIFKSSEVLVNTQCLLELFQFCWLCHEECCITIEGSERMFSVMQDCQSCGYQRDWTSHPPSVAAAQAFQKEEEHPLKDADGEEVVVQIVSSDNECSEQVFIKKDGSYLSNDEKEVSPQENEVAKKRKRKRKSNDSSDEQEPSLDEEAGDSDASMDEDQVPVPKEDSQGKLVLWCTQCETKASLSCSVFRHKKVFCCAQCSAGDDTQTQHSKGPPVQFDDFAGFQKHVEREHRSKLFYKHCQDCNKFIVADPKTGALNEHKCEPKSKFICPECGKRLLTEVGLKSHHTQLHSGAKHPCKYCLKVFKTRSAKMIHEQTHLKGNRGLAVVTKEINSPVL